MGILSEQTASGGTDTGSSSSRVTKRPLSFGTAVGPGSSVELEHTVKADATIENLTARFYAGPRLDLEIRPIIREQADEGTTQIVSRIGKDYLDGDDDVYRFDSGVPVEKGDTIVLELTNRDTDNSYDARVNMTLNREGGTRGVLAALREVLA